MKSKMITNDASIVAFRWKRFMHKPYAVFCSLCKFNIGVVAVASLAFANTHSVAAQHLPAPVDSTKEHKLGDVEVTGSRVPLGIRQAARIVTVLSHDDIVHAGVQSVNDLLKYVSGVDVRQRGGFGIQTDISVCGGTFDQVTVLLNGINVNDPQTGHLMADFPVAMDDIERIEIIEGPSSRVFGTSAFTGAINIITKKDKQSGVTARMSGGSYGLFETGASANFTQGALSQQLSGSYNRSDGATANSDFNTRRFFYQGSYSTPQADINWQGGYSNQKYGANTFYSAAYPNQYEETRRTQFAVKAETKGWLHLLPSIYWSRSYDHFQLIRSTHTAENFHRTDVYGINLNAYFSWFLGKTSLGAELRDEEIRSTSLGKPLDSLQYVNVPGERGIQYTHGDNRTNIDYYLEHNIILPHLTISMGTLINHNTSLDDKMYFYPGVDIAYHPDDRWKFYASWNKALRMPTFTDLYYQSPTLEGNIGLKPEKTQATKIGMSFRTNWFNTDLSGFYNKGTDMIDWVKYTANDVFHSANFKLDNMGITSDTKIDFTALWGNNSWLRNMNIGYAYIYQKRHDDKPIYKSNYALEYLRNKFAIGLTHKIYWQSLTATWNFRFQKRMGGYEVYDDNNKPTGGIHDYPSFGVLDLNVQWQKPHYQIFAQAYNLLNRHYYDYGNIPQPGTWLNAGVKYRF